MHLVGARAGGRSFVHKEHVQRAVVVDVGHQDLLGDGACAAVQLRVAHVPERAAALVDEQDVLHSVARDHHVRQPILIQVAQLHRPEHAIVEAASDPGAITLGIEGVEVRVVHRRRVKGAEAVVESQEGATVSHHHDIERAITIHVREGELTRLEAVVERRVRNLHVATSVDEALTEPRP